MATSYLFLYIPQYFESRFWSTQSLAGLTCPVLIMRTLLSPKSSLTGRFSGLHNHLFTVGSMCTQTSERLCGNRTHGTWQLIGFEGKKKMEEIGVCVCVHVYMCVCVSGWGLWRKWVGYWINKFEMTEYFCGKVQEAHRSRTWVHTRETVWERGRETDLGD